MILGIRWFSAGHLALRNSKVTMDYSEPVIALRNSKFSMDYSEPVIALRNEKNTMDYSEPGIAFRNERKNAFLSALTLVSACLCTCSKDNFAFRKPPYRSHCTLGIFALLN